MDTQERQAVQVKVLSVLLEGITHISKVSCCLNIIVGSKINIAQDRLKVGTHVGNEDNLIVCFPG